MESADALHGGSAGRLSWPAKRFPGRTARTARGLGRHPRWPDGAALPPGGGRRRRLPRDPGPACLVGGGPTGRGRPAGARPSADPGRHGRLAANHGLYRDLGPHLLMKHRPTPSPVLSAGLRRGRCRVGAGNLKVPRARPPPLERGPPGPARGGLAAGRPWLRRGPLGDGVGPCGGAGAG
jgi:hypothetical protein